MIEDQDEAPLRAHGDKFGVDGEAGGQTGTGWGWRFGPPRGGHLTCAPGVVRVSLELPGDSAERLRRNDPRQVEPLPVGGDGAVPHRLGRRAACDPVALRGRFRRCPPPGPRVELHPRLHPPLHLQRRHEVGVRGRSEEAPLVVLRALDRSPSASVRRRCAPSRGRRRAPGRLHASPSREETPGNGLRRWRPPWRRRGGDSVSRPPFDTAALSVHRRARAASPLAAAPGGRGRACRTRRRLHVIR
mmetsp:Transcript_40788/g.79812  ORF Transcript_40788/g.79812 Transcript_40788/m.79812 type:complete len:245 (+) Transcript_40788:1416-2150(+)